MADFPAVFATDDMRAHGPYEGSTWIVTGDGERTLLAECYGPEARTLARRLAASEEVLECLEDVHRLFRRTHERHVETTGGECEALQAMCRRIKATLRLAKGGA